MKIYFTELFWHLDDDIEKVKSGDELITKKELDSALPIKSGDSITLLYLNQQPALTFPIKGSKLRSLLKSLHTGLHTPLEANYHTAKIVYPIIGHYLQSKARIKLAKKFELNTLTPLELAGDYRYFTGCLRREKNGIWTYSLEN